MRKTVAAAVLCLALVGCKDDRFAGHLSARTAAISSQAAQIGAPVAIILGDSLTERSAIRTLCGMPVLNAGVGRAKLADLVDLAEGFATTDAPVRVLAAGVNDVSKGRTEAEFSEDAAALVAAFHPTVIVGVTGKDRARWDEILRNAAPDAVFVPGLPASLLGPDGIHYTPENGRAWSAALEGTCR